MSLVTLHVYDITNTQYETANAAIQGLNRFTKDTLGAGGIFHGAVEVNGDEWSYGYCDRGTGVSTRGDSRAPPVARIASRTSAARADQHLTTSVDRTTTH